MDGENILINEELSQTEVSRISSYSSVTENSGENYLMAISRIKCNNVQYSFIETDTGSSKNEFWTAYQEGNSNLRSLSSTGNSVRNIVNDDSWFTTTGKAMKKIASSQRVCVKNSGYIGSAIYTDIIIWQYSLTQPSQSGTASIRLQMLYNTTIIYKDSNYQEQKVYIVKRPSQCLKTCTYQSHFEVVGLYASGFTTLYNSSISYQRSYT